MTSGNDFTDRATANSTVTRTRKRAGIFILALGYVRASLETLSVVVAMGSQVSGLIRERLNSEDQHAGLYA